MQRLIHSALVFASVLAFTTENAHGQAKQPQKSEVDKAVQQLATKHKFDEECARAPATGVDGRIISLSPCSPPPVAAGSVQVEMVTELAVGSSEPQSRLLVQYLFCTDLANGKLILKQAHSLLLRPGTSVCGVEDAILDDLKPGSYELYGRVTVRNSDGSETIKAEKQCKFDVR